MSDSTTEITVPGDKSIAHRAVLLASLARGTSRLRNIPPGRDVRSSIACVESLGTSIREEKGECIIAGNGLNGLQRPDVVLDCGNSGTTMRLITGILAGQTFACTLTGDASLRRRPMDRVMVPLEKMGAVFRNANDGRAPFLIQGTRPLHAIGYTLPMASAQVKSAIIFAGLFADGETRVYEHEVTRDHTERMLGVVSTVDAGRRVVRVRPRDDIDPIDMRIPGDPSSAAFLIVASLLRNGSRIVIRNVSVNPTRTAFLKILTGLGARFSVTNQRVEGGEPSGDIEVMPSSLSGEVVLDKEIAGVIDEIPVLAVGCMCCGIPFTVRNASELRHKESDRLALLVSNLRKIGCDVEEYEDGFASRTKNGLIGASIATHGDHRMSMAFGVAGLIAPDITVDDPSCVDVSFPGFWEVLNGLRD